MLPPCGYPRKTYLYIMSASPPPEKDVEQNAQSGEEQDPIDRTEEGAQGQGMTDFEVKEQDRWLPIANGNTTLCFYLLVSFRDMRVRPCAIPTECATMLVALKTGLLIRHAPLAPLIMICIAAPSA